MNVGIIGGGIIGLSTAYYLSKSGHEVTVIEQGDLKDGCSFGNAGMIVPSHIIPLAAPGMISKGIRWMFDSTSPFYVKPRLSWELLTWGYQFYKHATTRHVVRSIPALKELSLFSKARYQELARELPFDFEYHERGLLMLYKTKETEHEEAETARVANDHGIEARILSAEEVQQLEPDVKINVRGGVYFAGDAHITPQTFINGLITFLKDNNVKFLTNTSVRNFSVGNGKIQSITAGDNNYAFDEVVIATGSWSGALAKQLNLNVPMQAGKGYSFTISDVKKNVRVPSIFLEARVAVTPMGNTLRFGGTMEITGVDHSVNMERVKGIVNSIPQYYPEMKVEMPVRESVWHGLRPCSPDGLPYIGRVKGIKNLVVATGHAMMGLSLGPGTGQLVSELINQQKASIDLQPFAVDRY
ncbi:MAG: FAD-dependent oxidoreductase [Cyclobacteriaceae bacterium]|nr:FAD-dependent oxidoreductase [Cyclobacteriaceae bacterium]